MKGVMGHTPLQLILLPQQPLLFGGEIWSHAGRATDKQRRLLFRNKDGLSREWTDREVLKLQQAGDLRFLTAADRDQLEKAAGPATPRTILDTCTAVQKKIVDWKRTYVRAWEDAGRPSRTIAMLEPLIAATAHEIRDHAPPSVRQLQRHLATHLETGGDPEAFVPQTENKGNRQRRLPGEMLDRVGDWVAKRYLVEPGPTLTVVHSLVQQDWSDHNKLLPPEQQLPKIKRSLVYELIRFTDRYTETFCHRGKREADHKFRMVEDGPVTERHNEAWEIDHTAVDLIVVDDKAEVVVGRPFITMAIDRHTRMIVGYHVGWAFPGIQPTLECLRCAIAIKDELLKKLPGLRNHWPPFGTPGLLVPDNAKHFKSKAFKEACRRLGIDVARPPVLKSWYKGKIERAFGTYVRGLCHLIPGTTFSSVYQRLKERPPEKVATCTLAEFDAMLLRWIVDIYNPGRNRTMNTSPLLPYGASVAKWGQKLPPNPAELASKPSIPYYRKVSREGILFEGLMFRGVGLADLLVNKRLSRSVLVKVDPNDLTHIWFIHPATNETIEWKICKSQAASVQGIHLDVHLLAKAMQRNEPELLSGEAGRVEAYALIHKMLEARVRGDGLANRRLAAKHLDRLRMREVAYVVEEADDDEDATPPEDLDIGDELFPADASGALTSGTSDEAPRPVATPDPEPAPPAVAGPRIVAAVAEKPKKRGRPKGSGGKAAAAPAPSTPSAPTPAPVQAPAGTDDDLDLDRFVSGKPCCTREVTSHEPRPEPRCVEQHLFYDQACRGGLRRHRHLGQGRMGTRLLPGADDVRNPRHREDTDAGELPRRPGGPAQPGRRGDAGLQRQELRVRHPQGGR